MSDEMKILSGNVQQLTDNKKGNDLESYQRLFKALVHPEKKEIEHTYTSKLVCPYCGYEDRDSWELSDYDDRHMCGSCEKEFGFERIVYCEYTSWFIEDKH